MEISKDLLEAIKSYYSVLEKTGYIPYAEVDKLLVFSFMEELLTEELSQFITEKDYKDIIKYINCQYGSCLLPWPDYLKTAIGITRKIPDEYRATERNSLRSINKNPKLRIL